MLRKPEEGREDPDGIETAASRLAAAVAASTFAAAASLIIL